MSFPVKQHALSLLDQHPDAYTVIFPDPASLMGVRAGLARGMSTEVSGGSDVQGTNDFDEIAIFHRPMGNATWNAEQGEWQRFLPATSPRFTMTPTEPFREVVYRCQPFWYKLTSLGTCGPHAVSVADKPLPGFRLAPMFQNGTDYVYRSAFWMSLGADGMPHSRGEAEVMQGGLAELLTAARRYDGRARLEGVREWFSDLLLQMVEFACADPSAILPGSRLTEPSRTGKIAAEAKGNCYYNSARGDGCIWRGKEHPWGGALAVLPELMALHESAAEGTQPHLYYLSHLSHFTGRIGKQYAWVGRLPAVSEGEATSVSGYAFSEKGEFLYPAREAQGIMAARGKLAAECGGLSDSPLCVSVGGSHDSAMRLELSYTDGARGSALCGRLMVG